MPERLLLRAPTLIAFTLIASTLIASIVIASTLLAQDAKQLSQEDARLNETYQRRVAQLRADPAGLAALRSQERDWIKQRDQQCGKDVTCLTQATRAHADYFEQQVSQNDLKAKPGSPIPQELWGKWTVGKVIPTQNAGCWDQKQADALVGTLLEYHADSFAWKNKTVRNLGSTTSTLQAKKFAEDNSASAGSVDFHQLGINTASVKQIEIQHPDATVYDSSADCCAAVPGETVLIIGSKTFVFGVCGVYYGATRVTAGKD